MSPYIIYYKTNTKQRNCDAANRNHSADRPYHTRKSCILSLL